MKGRNDFHKEGGILMVLIECGENQKKNVPSSIDGINLDFVKLFEQINAF